MRTGETLSEWGRIDPGERARRTDAVWADERVHRLPKGWRNLLIEEHQKMHATAGRLLLPGDVMTSAGRDNRQRADLFNG